MDVVEKPIISELNGAKKMKKAQTPPPSEIDVTEPIYDYMKYDNKKKSKTGAMLKHKKRVSFRRIVEQVTFTEDWKMLTSESNLRTEEEQV
ncbi:hypothetical protein KR044_010092 [Drosophila immigrans]|nr:hypothetical protein KR044_010092 [Drosophila immigrans]